MKSTPLTASVILLPAEHMGPLIEHGATIDYADAEEHTALMAAAMVGDEDCLRLLLERGADFLKAYNENHTALQMAIHDGNSGCMKLLLARADFMLQRLKVTAERGDKHAQTLVDEEKIGRGESMAKEAAEAAARQKAREEREALQKPAEGENRGVEAAGDPAATSVESVSVPASEDRQIDTVTQDTPNQQLSSSDAVDTGDANGRVEGEQTPEPSLTSYPARHSMLGAGDEEDSKAEEAQSTWPGAEETHDI